MRASGLLLAVALQAMPAPALASAPELFGFGARGMATAGTLTATASGHEAVYYNPAGLAFDRRPSFSIGYQRADFFLSIDGRSQEIEAAPATLIGIGVPIPFLGPLAERVGLGFGFVLPQTSVLVADIPRPGVPRFVRLATRAQTVSLMGAGGVRILDDLAIGAGFIALSELEGAINVAPNDAGRLGTRVRDQLVADYSLIAGALWRPLDFLSVGVVFRDESSAEFTLPITADLGPGFPLPVPRLDISGTAQFDPRQLGVAASIRVLPELLLSASAAWEQWSRFENPIVYTAVPRGYPAQPPARFSDVISARAGAELTLALGEVHLTPRAGVALLPTPVPGDNAYVDATRIIAAAGAGVTWWALTLDAAFQAHVLTTGGALIAWSVELGVEL